VRPEAADYLDKARHCLTSAKTIASSGLPDVAAREAYLAAFHAAEAYIFERTGKAAKTHRGVRSELNRLMGPEAGINRRLLAFLAEGYEFKTIADYGIGPSQIEGPRTSPKAGAPNDRQGHQSVMPGCHLYIALTKISA
jgi:uncharacterized protein (UPF0332 family)